MTPERINEIGRALEGRNDAETAQELLAALCDERATTLTLAGWIRATAINPEAIREALAYANSCGATL